MHLRELDLSGTALAAGGLAALLRAPALAELTALRLNNAAGTDDSEPRDLAALAAAPCWPGMEVLGLRKTLCPGAALAPLCRPGGPAGLRALDLGGTALRTEGVRHLCAAPFADRLVWLNLFRNYLDDDALIAMAESGRFARLRSLDLRTNGPKLPGHNGEQITDAGAERLANAPALARLRDLNLYSTGITARGVDAVLHGPHWNLRTLVVGGCDLGPEVVGVLARSPRLARLAGLSLAFNKRLDGKTLLPLAESPHLSPLCWLDVSGINVDPKVRAAFQARLGRRLDRFDWEKQTEP
jgi:hypothetical protein